MPDHQDRQKSQPTPWPEWITGLLGLAFVIGTLGILLHRGLTAEGTPPDIAVRIEAIVDQSSGHLVTFVAQNRGDETGSNVRVSGELRRDGSVVERSSVDFDFVPTGSEQRGGLFFRTDPRQGELILGAEGYAEP